MFGLCRFEMKIMNISRNTLKLSDSILVVWFRCFSQQVQQIPQSQPNLNQKLIKVAIIGIPNAGKSTVINGLMDRRVCATSKRVHTTRKSTHAIFTRNDTQVVFLDTPGLVTEIEQKKHCLEKTIRSDLTSSVIQSDIIGVIHDVSDYWTKNYINKKVIDILETYIEKPSFLILNKIDLLKSKRQLLELSRLLTENHLNGNIVNKSLRMKTDLDLESQDARGWRYFSDLFMISALNNDGLEEIREYLLKNARPAPWMYDETEWCNDTPESLIVQAVKAKVLDYCSHEVPYKIQCEMEMFDIEADGSIKAVIVMKCPNERLEKIVTGTDMNRLTAINVEVTKDLISTFNQNVQLRIETVVVKSDNKSD